MVYIIPAAKRTGTTGMSVVPAPWVGCPLTQLIPLVRPVGEPHPLEAAVGRVRQGIEDRVRDLLGALDGEDTAGGEVAGDAHPVVTLPPVDRPQGVEQLLLDLRTLLRRRTQDHLA